MEGKYIYGIMKSNNEAPLAIIGLGGSGPVYTIAHKSLACVLSDYSGRELGSMSREEVIRCLLAHQMVVEQVMREHTVLPVKFGTVLATPDEVRDLLSAAHQQFCDALAWITDKVEVEVAATWDTAQVLREISAEPEIIRVKEAIAERPAQETLEERIRLGQMAKAAMDRRRDSYRERMIGFLRPVAIDVQPNALIADEMVMNVAFLIPREREKDFDCRMRRLNGSFRDQLHFRVIGPLPPYSFSMVEVRRPDPREIEGARQVLGLGAEASAREIKEAYRRLAAKSHPDACPGEDGASQGFARLRQAFGLLVNYGRGQGDTEIGNGDGRRYSFRPEDVSRAFLVEIKGPGPSRSPCLGNRWMEGLSA